MRATLAGVVLALSIPLAAQAQERQIWTFTCTKAGRMVYRERVADRPTPVKEQEVNRRNPGAVCLLLAPEEPGAAATADLRAVLEQARPGGGVLSYASPIAPPQGASIDAALRALKGEPMAVVVPPLQGSLAQPPAPAEPLGVDVSLGSDAPEAPEVRPARPGWVRLALYRGADEEEVLADWMRIGASDLAFAPFSPALTEVGEGRTMLAVGPVSQAERPELCLAASRHGLDCLSAEEGEGAPMDGPALAALAKSYPGLVAWGWQPEMSPRRQGVAPDTGDALTCSAPGPARRPGVDLVALGAALDAAREAQNPPKEGAGPSASSARLSSLPRASTTRSRTRSAPPVIR